MRSLQRFASVAMLTTGAEALSLLLKIVPGRKEVVSPNSWFEQNC